jgi:hypothetical protein
MFGDEHQPNIVVWIATDEPDERAAAGIGEEKRERTGARS